MTVSGLNDYDYPSFSSQPSLQSLACLQHVGEVRKTPLPHELVEQFKRMLTDSGEEMGNGDVCCVGVDMQCSCYMGLFPEIGRAWLSIDSDVFIWNYEDG